MSNALTLERLLATCTIRVERGRLFERSLAAKPPEFDFSRVQGMLLGLAIGDALGITTEGMLPGARSAAFGEIRDYLPNRHTGERRGFPSDDTQLAF